MAHQRSVPAATCAFVNHQALPRTRVNHQTLQLRVRQRGSLQFYGNNGLRRNVCLLLIISGHALVIVKVAVPPMSSVDASAAFKETVTACVTDWPSSPPTHNSVLHLRSARASSSKSVKTVEYHYVITTRCYLYCLRRRPDNEPIRFSRSYNG